MPKEVSLVNLRPVEATDKIGEKVALAAQNAVTFPHEMNWKSVGSLPSFMVNGVRTLGNSIFSLFPCYQTHKNVMEKNGREALSEIKFVSSIAGAVAFSSGDMNKTVEWILQNGVIVDKAIIEMAVSNTRYRPEIIMALSDTYTFLLVRDTPENGSGVSGQYVYAWVGGAQHYLNKVEDTAKLNRLGDLAIGGPRTAVSRQRNIPRIVEVTEEDKAAVRMIGAPDIEKRKNAIKALPEEEVSGSVNLVKEFRKSGFIPFGQQQTPTFKKVLSDGRFAILVGQKDVPAVETQTFNITVYSDNGDVEVEGEICSPEDLEEIMNSNIAPSI